MTLRDWFRELRKRWPLLVGVLRGKTVVYQARLGPPEDAMITARSPHGAVVHDVVIFGPQPPDLDPAAPARFRLLADWFDATRPDDLSDEVQRDLRRWADEWETALQPRGAGIVVPLPDDLLRQWKGTT